MPVEKLPSGASTGKKRKQESSALPTGAASFLKAGSSAGGKKKRRGKHPELSADPIDYDDYHAKGYWDWAFGYGPYNRNFRDKVTFR